MSLWKDYRNYVNERWFEGEEYPELRDLFAASGLAGEVGELVEVIKKSHRPGKKLDEDKFISEAGDVLFYYTKLLSLHGLTLRDVIEYNIEKLNKRNKIGE